MSYKEGGWVDKYMLRKVAKKCRGCRGLKWCKEAAYNCPVTESVSPEAKYFVLRLDTDPHARKAMEAYANSVETDSPEFANDIRAKLAEILLREE